MMASVRELQARLDAVRDVVESGGQRFGMDESVMGAQCRHGLYSWDDCIACYDECILAAVEGRDPA